MQWAGSDADMLDALGAIGIMRAFMSKPHLPPYDSEEPFGPDSAQRPPAHASDQVRLQLKFYDWLLTDTARQMAEERATYMRGFITQMRWELSAADYQ
jgi:HD superfamily phosphodiesterase